MIQQVKIRQMALCSMFVALISICSYISIPLPFSPVPVTMQTFALFCTGLLLERKLSVTTVIIYMFIGAVGVPVFAGFNAGFGVFAGPTGGFLIGFLPALFVMATVRDKMCGTINKTLSLIVAAVLGLTIIYAIGCIQLKLWMNISMAAALSIGVLPYVLPDLLKIALAVAISKTLLPVLRYNS